MRGKFLFVAVFLCVFSVTAGAHAVSFGLNVEYTGGAEPQGAPPWLKATFEDVKAEVPTVQLTMDASGLTDSEFVGAWYFNLADELTTSLSLLINNQSGPLASVSRGLNSFRAGNNLGDGFDLFFDFPQANGDRFGAGLISTFTISGKGLSAESFNLVNVPKEGTGTFYSAAHVQSIGSSKGSGWIAASDTKQIPEPSILLSLGLGIVGLGLIARKKLSK